jgi:hypothetical protein
MMMYIIQNGLKKAYEINYIFQLKEDILTHLQDILQIHSSDAQIDSTVEFLAEKTRNLTIYKPMFPLQRTPSTH